MGNFFRSLFRGAPGPALQDDASPPTPPPAAPGGATVLDAETTTRLARALVVLGTEIWRARGKLPRNGEGTDARGLRLVETSLDKMAGALESLGLRHDDPSGRTWDERDPVKVLVFEETPGLTRPQVIEVVKPTLYLGESLLSAGEVVVGVPPGTGAADEQGR